MATNEVLPEDWQATAPTYLTTLSSWKLQHQGESQILIFTFRTDWFRWLMEQALWSVLPAN